MAPHRLIGMAVLVVGAVLSSGAAMSGTTGPAPQPLLPELAGRTFEAVGTVSDVGWPDAAPGLGVGDFLELRFTATSVVAVTPCGQYAYPPLTVRDTGAWFEIDFGSPTGPTCTAAGGTAPPRGTLFWTDTGSGSYSLGNGVTGLRLTEPTVTWWRSAWFVVPVLLVLGGLTAGLAVRARRRRGRLDGHLWPPGG